MSSGWPRFANASFTGWDAVPSGIRDLMMTVGVPQDFFGRRYRALPKPTVETVPNRGPLVLFGTVMGTKGMYLDPSTGEILVYFGDPGHEPTLVNNNLERFSATVKAMIELFPYYSSDDDLATYLAAGDYLAATIEAIDPRGLSWNGFWETFVNDVKNGDFAT